MRKTQQSVCKAGNANVLQSYDSQVPRDVCLKVVRGCLLENAIAADRSARMCGCSYCGKKLFVSCFTHQGSPVADMSADAKITPFDSTLFEICRDINLTKHLFHHFFLSPCDQPGNKSTIIFSGNIGTNLFDMLKWHICCFKKGQKQIWNSCVSKWVHHMLRRMSDQKQGRNCWQKNPQKLLWWG